MDGLTPSSNIEQYLPAANIERIMKTVLASGSEGRKLSKESKEFMQEIVSEFVHFVTFEALRLCHEQQRRVITGQDIVKALCNLGFSDYDVYADFFLNISKVKSKSDVTLRDMVRDHDPFPLTEIEALDNPEKFVPSIAQTLRREGTRMLIADEITKLSYKEVFLAPPPSLIVKHLLESQKDEE
ncbi:Transcription factor NFYB/HAP3 like protein [Aduncisulcus paluster]|uniref:Transcription factor NFYB/HAP3 like protein n=1 Tax=Aduncisulcus paluster TaxID=2918883 RepID=A0ABQ5K4T5_9EUKA|nr:Transcription factor NFYB/HAP3 like protein [Aduncisulcus paluster]